MKKFFIFLTLLIILYLPFFVLSQERPLEVDYPRVGNINLDTSSVTLPGYVKYIFIFALIISGLIILGTLLYGGFLYLTSAGNPIILSEAKKRILSSFLGVLILFGAYIIFNTINPQIVKPKLEPLLKVEAFIKSGIYICEKITRQEQELTQLLNNYKREDITIEKRQEVVKKINEIMLQYKCEIIPNSLVLEKSRNMSNTTFFSIPPLILKSDPQSGKSFYAATTTEYGLVLHELRDYKGKCFLLDKATSGYLYMDISPSNITEYDYNGSFKSITIFKKTSTDIKPSASVTLYSCLNYNEGTGCVGGDNTIIDAISMKYEISDEKNNIRRILNFTLKENVRSIQLEPEGKVFVIFYDKDSPIYNQMCQIIYNNDRNLLDEYIGRCHAREDRTGYGAYNVQIGSCTFATTRTEESQIQRCKPCMKSMYIIKGEIL